ncbi:MAG: DUF5916 domain-containing protein [Bacteroidota bacterium]
MRLSISLLLLGLLAMPVWAQAGLMQAQRLSTAPTIDGQLDDAAWQQLQPITGFRQVEPNHGEPAALATTVWMGFDDRNLYVAAFMADTTGRAGMRVPDLRRDFEWADNDVFGVMLDPFGDSGSVTSLQVTPMATQRDMLVANGVQANREWDAVWQARTQMTPEGWTAEMAIPWSTLRYPVDAPPTWRVNFVRKIRRANEVHAWGPYPRALNGHYMEYGGDVAGLEPPPPARNVRAQPYLTTTYNRVGDDNDTTPDVGGELKWAVTSNSVLDLTVNTDFAQADADRQVINLTRFSVFFPERRAFFLENAELFDLGSSLSVKPFFSRRIGLDGFGQPLTLDGGARFVSRTAKRGGGGLVMRQRGNAEAPDAWFGVGRYLQNVGPRGQLGGLITLRQDAALGDQRAVTNTTVTLDGFMQPTESFAADWLVSQSVTDGAPGDGFAAHTWIRNNADWGYIGHVQGIITEDYNAGVGFVGRRNLIVTSPAVTLDFRPEWLPSAVRRWQPGFSAFLYHEYSTGRFQEGSTTIRPFYLEFQNGAEISLYARPHWQRLNESEAARFRPLGLTIAPGDYTYTQFGLYAISDLSKPLGASFNGRTGPYFDGHIATAEATLRVAPLPNIAFQLDYVYNRITDLGAADQEATSHLIIPELRLALNPRVQLNAFYQYNTFADQGAWNVRFGWEFSPLSFLYLVFNDSRFFVDDTLRRGNPERFLTQQQAIFKVSYLRQL